MTDSNIHELADLIENLPENEVCFSVCIDNAAVLSNEYVKCRAYTPGDAITIVACDYIQNAVRKSKGIAYLGDISLTANGPTEYVLQCRQGGAISRPVRFLIRNPDEDDAECVFSDEYL